MGDSKRLNAADVHTIVDEKLHAAIGDIGNLLGAFMPEIARAVTSSDAPAAMAKVAGGLTIYAQNAAARGEVIPALFAEAFARSLGTPEQPKVPPGALK